jgi:hypothetical protein
MGYKSGTRFITIAQMRVTFFEYPPMLYEDLRDLKKDPKKMDVIWGDDVKQFSDQANGSAWNAPDAQRAAVLFDQIAKNKSLALRLETVSTVDRLREAARNKTVLSFVELAVLEASQAYIDGDYGLLTSPYKDARSLDMVRLNKCRVVNAIPSKTSPLEVHFKADSAEPRRHGGGSICPSWACGSNHNETLVLDTAMEWKL